MIEHLVRVGSLGHLGRFPASEVLRYRRGMSVVCRTARGLEFGSVLNQLQPMSMELPRAGQILRGATPEDHLLWDRLQKHRLEAIAECQRLLDARDLSGTLMDCEVLFDGQSIFFYFLGEVDPEVEHLTTELAETYNAKSQLRQFAETMTLGCGPDCGTKDGGCVTGGCATCAVTAACSRNGE